MPNAPQAAALPDAAQSAEPRPSHAARWCAAKRAMLRSLEAPVARAMLEHAGERGAGEALPRAGGHAPVEAVAVCLSEALHAILPEVTRALGRQLTAILAQAVSKGGLDTHACCPPLTHTPPAFAAEPTV